MTLALSLVSLFAVAALVYGVVLGYPPARQGAPLLNAKEQAVLAASADAFFPGGGALPISGSEAGILGYMNTTLGASPPRTRLLLRLLLRLVEHGPWLFNLSRRFTRQSPAERIKTLQAWGDSRIYFLRISFTSLRTLVSMAYLANSRVTSIIGAVPNLAPFEAS